MLHFSTMDWVLLVISGILLFLLINTYNALRQKNKEFTYRLEKFNQDHTSRDMKQPNLADLVYSLPKLRDPEAILDRLFFGKGEKITALYFRTDTQDKFNIFKISEFNGAIYARYSIEQLCMFTMIRKHDLKLIEDQKDYGMTQEQITHIKREISSLCDAITYRAILEKRVIPAALMTYRPSVLAMVINGLEQQTKFYTLDERVVQDFVYKPNERMDIQYVLSIYRHLLDVLQNGYFPDRETFYVNYTNLNKGWQYSRLDFFNVLVTLSAAVNIGLPESYFRIPFDLKVQQKTYNTIREFNRSFNRKEPTLSLIVNSDTTIEEIDDSADHPPTLL